MNTQKSTTIANASHISKSISLYINIPSEVKFKLVSSDLEQIRKQMKNRPIKNTSPVRTEMLKGKSHECKKATVDCLREGLVE